MRFSRLWLRGSFLALALLEVGCNATTTDTNNTTNQSASGVWSGSDSVSGLGVTAIINSAGQGAFMRSDGVLFTGVTQVSGSSLAVTVDGYPDFSATFSDGSDYGIGTLDGSVMSGTTLTGTLTFTTNGNTSIPGNWSLSYQAISNNNSSSAAISGNYTDTVTGAVIAISTAGVLSGQTAANGCALSGSVATSDSAHNVYEVAYSYKGCTGTYAVLNGVQFTGLATLNANLSPAQILMAVTGTASTTADKYALVSSLTAS
jgi:hypothetical protein